jgi:hypothetical protein
VADDKLVGFIRESNKIERIDREVTIGEIFAYKAFLGLKEITIEDVCDFVGEIEPRAILRNREGRNISIQGAEHLPPPGGLLIEDDLRRLLVRVSSLMLTPFHAHVRYERLHPFTDGNGRSGRAIWAWQMKNLAAQPFALPFLQRFYYQTIDAHALDPVIQAKI